MLSITLHLLSGRYIATAYNDRSRVEWPPHPSRLFSALVSTWADHTQDPSERLALLWLEQQQPPIIYASLDPCPRDVTTVFVPVNDTSVISHPSLDKLHAAEDALASVPPGNAKALAKAQKILQNLQKKLLDDTLKAVAAPSKEPSAADQSAARKLFPEHRTRQPRTFPSATPASPLITFLWSEAKVSPAAAASLQQLLSRLIRVGHSSSFVRATLDTPTEAPAPPPDTQPLIPDEDDGAEVIRWVGPGQLDRLTTAFDRHKETEPRVLPARFFRYRVGLDTPQTKPVTSIFDPKGVVFVRADGPRLPITTVAAVSRQLRRALMASADVQPPPRLLSGHNDDSSPSQAPHLAIVPLPVVNAPHAEGTLLGVALIFPRDCDPTERAAVMRAIGRLEALHPHTDPFTAPMIPLKLGRPGVLGLQRVAWGEDSRSTLRIQSWSRPSNLWASATPVALDRNPGDLHHKDPDKRRAAFDAAEAIVVEAVKRIGLPSPAEVQVHRSCVVTGAAKPIFYPRFPHDEQRPQRVLVHVRLRFDDRVQGPVLIGAGRNHGLGLCLPVFPPKQQRPASTDTD